MSQIRERIRELQASPQETTPQKRIDKTAKRIKSAKLWDSDPPKWERLQLLLNEIEELLVEKEE